MNHLRDIRKSRDITMKELGEIVGVTEAAIGYYETGKRNINYEMLLRLSEALNCSVDDIVNGEKIPATESDGQIKTNSIILSDKDLRFVEWFHSLPQEKQKAILISQDAPEDLL